MSNLYFSHGDKGGVGKSLVSALLVDALLIEGRKVLLVEGDHQGDIADRFIDCPEVELEVVNLNRAGAAEEAIMTFSSVLEDAGGRDVVVNLPSGAGDTLEELSDVLIPTAESLELVVTGIYSLGHQAPATRNAVETLSNGLMSRIHVQRRFMAFPLFQGEPENFHWVLSGQREKFPGVHEVAIPAIKPERFAIKVLSLPGRLSGLVDANGGLTVGERMLFQQKFLKPALAAMSQVIKNGE